MKRIVKILGLGATIILGHSSSYVLADSQDVDLGFYEVYMRHTRGDAEFKGGGRGGGPCLDFSIEVTFFRNCFEINGDFYLFECGGKGGRYEPRHDHTTLEGSLSEEVCLHRDYRIKEFLSHNRHQDSRKSLWQSFEASRYDIKDYRTNPSGRFDRFRFDPRRDLAAWVEIAGDREGNDAGANDLLTIQLGEIRVEGSWRP